MKTVLIVTGAGASADVANESTTTQNDWRPPLAKELFTIHGRPAFEPALRRFRGADVLGSELAELSLRSTFSLEQTLRQYSLHADPRVREHFKDVPRYVCAVVRACAQQYVQSPANYLRLIMTLMTTEHRLVIVDLNYDDLLERALYSFDNRLVVDSLDSGIMRKRQARLFKPHGSIKWFARREESQSPAGITYHDPDPPFRVEFNNNSLEEKAEWMPVIAPPLADKALEDLAFPEHHLTSLGEALGDCNKALFIGTSAQDAHVLGFIDKHVPNRGEVTHIVSFEDSQVVRERIMHTMPQLARRHTRNFDNGFRKYINGDDFREFVST